MDQNHLNKLQEEVEDLRRALQKKQAELNRFQSEKQKQNVQNKNIETTTPEQTIDNLKPPMFWTPATEQNQPADKGINYQTQNTSSNITHHNSDGQVQECPSLAKPEDAAKSHIGKILPRWAIERYSRQILLPEIGVSGQQKLCSSRVLVVGAGGLGCPAAVYLAGAGVGEIGIVDYDAVDLTNIHRQFLHGEEDEHLSKAESAANSLRRINSRIKVTPYNVQLNSENAVQIASRYDVVLDCTDNVPTRYLLNDHCVLSKLPLISGSALKMEGQLTVYGYRPKTGSSDKCAGPCYRCVFPAPPPAEAVGSCSSSGVAGPVPGAIGALQALEAIKYIVDQPRDKLLVGRMLLFDGEDMTFRTVKLRPRNPNCAVCSETPSITQLIDYEVFCKAQAKEKMKKTRLKPDIPKRETEKAKRMTGQSYYGFRTQLGPQKWVQDVPKSERKMGPACKPETCKKRCTLFDNSTRTDIFKRFWNVLDWKGKKGFVRGMVDSVPVKRRRVKLKGVVSRKGGSRLYHLLLGGERIAVCRTLFLNTLGIKEAMLRCWLLNEDRPKASKEPIKAINVESYIDTLPKLPPKCRHCVHSGTKTQYIHIENIKNIHQLYNEYCKVMKTKNLPAASRKTFTKVVNMRNDLDLQILPPEHRISAPELKACLSRDCEQRHLLVDVRNEAEFDMCRIDGSVNYPIEKLHGDSFERLMKEIRERGNQVTFICRRGNDSQVAAKKVLEVTEMNVRGVNDLRGGLHSWSKEVDQEFPVY